jgi:hypothetical protein
LLDGSEKDLFHRAYNEVRELAKKHGCGQKAALLYLAGPRDRDYPNWDAATKVQREKLGIWKARTAAQSEMYGKEVGPRLDFSRFADRIAAKLHIDD